MTRQFRASRPQLAQADDIQRQIDYLPSTVTISRPGTTGDGVHQAKGALSVIGSFECILVLHERINKSSIDVKDVYGQASKSTYILIALAGQDQFGRPITFRQGDFAFDGSQSYLIDSRTDWGFKTEGILELIE